jgi:hypothetical protein
MCSGFLVSHPSSPFFTLSESEWNEAVKKYPSLSEESEVSYLERSCTGTMIPGQDNYFDNLTILSQFERLFQMLEFKKEYHVPFRHDFEVLVDNATTHTAVTLKLNDFR